VIVDRFGEHRIVGRARDATAADLSNSFEFSP
jgi:hypothetical protein